MKTFNFYQKILMVALLCLWGGYTHAQMILVSGTEFSSPGNEDESYVSLDEIEFIGLVRPSISHNMTLTPSAAAGVFKGGKYYAVTNNPAKLAPIPGGGVTDEYFYDNNDAYWGLVVSNQTDDYMLTFSAAGIKTTAGARVEIEYCIPMRTQRDVAGGAGGTANFKVAVSGKHDSYNIMNGDDCQLDFNNNNGGYCRTLISTLTAAQVAASGGTITVYINAKNMGSNPVLIKSIKIYAEVDAKIAGTEEVCAGGESTTLSAAQTYLGNLKYQWYAGNTAIAGETGTTYRHTSNVNGVASTNYHYTITTADNTVITSAVFTVKDIICCLGDNGAPASRKLIWQEDFGTFTSANNYWVWDYRDIANPVKVAKTSTNAWRRETTSSEPPYTLTNATYVATGDVPEQGARSGYAIIANIAQGVNGLNWSAKAGNGTQWTGTTYFPDHTYPDREAYGACLMINCSGTPGEVLYNRKITGLCDKKLTIKCFINNFSDGDTPVQVTITAKDVATGLTATKTESRHAKNDGLAWKEVSFDLDLASGSTEVEFTITSSQSGATGGNDLLLDDIQIYACSAPSVELFFDLNTYSTEMESCEGDDVTLEVDVTTMLAFHYNTDLSYIFQYTTEDPSSINFDKKTWTNINNNPISASSITGSDIETIFENYKNTLADPTGKKIYFRVVAGERARLQSLMSTPSFYFNAEDPCSDYSVSMHVGAEINCPKCTEPKAITISSTPAATAGSIKTVSICSGNVELKTNDITLIPAYTDYTITWYKGNKTTVAGTTTGTQADPLTVRYADISAAGTTGVKYYVKVVDKNFPDVTSCHKWDSILVIGNPIPQTNFVSNQTICSDGSTTAVTLTSTPANATFIWSATASGVTGLATANGTTASIPSETLTASGSTAGTVTYTIKPTLSGCVGPDSTFTITVNPKAVITLTSAAATAAQTLCVNKALTNITYSLTGGATNATISGLPTGVAGNFASGTFTISGTPTEDGTFNYKIVTSGHTAPCTADSVTGTITVNPLPTVNTITPKVYCSGETSGAINFTSSVTGTTFTWTNNNTDTGLAANGSGNIAAFTTANTGATAIISTITVTPTANGCIGPDSTFTITVNPKAVITLTSATGTDGQTVCQNEAVTTITYSLSGGATNATITGLPAGVSGSITTPGVFTISGTPTVSGSFPYTITTSGHVSPCTAVTATGTLTVNEIPDITNVTPGDRCGDGTVTLGATASAGTINWYSAQTAGASLGTGASFTTPTLTTTTGYWVDATANNCTTAARTEVKATIKTIPAAPTVTDHISCPAKATTNITWLSLVTAHTGTLTWYDADAGGSVVPDPDKFDASVSLKKSYWVTQTEDGCESTRAEVKVEISAEPQNPTITPYDECAVATGSAKSWSELVTTAGTLHWYSADNDASLMGAPPASFNTGTAMAQATYYVIVEDGQGCKTNRAAVTARVKARPTASLSGDATICKGANADLTVTFTGSAPFKFIYSDGTNPSAEITSTTNSYTIASLSPTTTTTYTLVSVSDAQCSGVASDMSGTPVITVNDRPTVGAVTAIPALCTGGSFTPTDPTVTANGSAVTSTYWEMGSGATFVPITFPYTVSDADNGKTLRFAAVNDCGTTTSETTLTVNTLPTVPSTTIAPFCQGSTPPALPTISGFTSTEWKDESGVVVTSINSVDASLSNIYDYTVKVTDGNGCVSAPATIPVTVVSNPLAPGINNDVVYYREDVGGDDKFKNVLTQDPSFITQASGTDLLWSEDGGATWSSVVPVPPTPSAMDFVDKTYTYQVKQKNTASPNCESQPSTVTARIYLIPVPKVKNISYCVGEPSIQLDEPVVEIDPTGGYVKSDFELRWYSSDNPSDLSYTTTNPTPATNVTQEIVYWVSQFNLGPSGAESSRVPLHVYVYAKPTLTITNPAAVCYPATVNIASGSVWTLTDPNSSFSPLPSGVNYFSGTPGSLVSMTDSQAKALSRVTPSEETYYIQGYLTLPSGTQCASDPSAVKIQIHDLTPAIKEGLASRACPGTVKTLTADPVILYNPGTPVYSWTRTDTGLTGTGPTFDTGGLPLLPGETVVIDLAMSQGACPSTSAPSHTITIGDGPILGTMTITEQNLPGKSQTFTNDVSRVFYTCGNDFDITTSYQTDKSDFVWTNESGVSIATGPTLPTRSLTSGTATYTLSYTNECPTRVSITVHSVPVTATATMAKMQLCENEEFQTTLSIQMNDPEGLSHRQITWYHDGNPIAGESAPTYHIANAQPTHSGVYEYAVSNRGCVSTDTIRGYDVKGNPGVNRLDVSARVTAGLLPSTPICEGESIDLGFSWVNPANAQILWNTDATIVQISADDKIITANPFYRPNSDYRSEYTYRVKLINQYCGLDTIVKAEVDKPLQGAVLGNMAICEGQTVTLDAGSYEATSYVWTSTAYDGMKYGSVQYEKPVSDNEYYLSMERGECRVHETLSVTVHSRPLILYIDSISPRSRDIVPDYDYGTQPFQYGVDNQDPDGNSLKTDLTFGKHSFRIIDDLGCQSNTYDYILDAPKIFPPPYFTPDGDGINDRWEIPVLREVYPEATVTIYDRYGKKLIEYRGAESGWDGTYKGNSMPSTDYWYEIDVDEIDKQYVGHFTLVRK